MHSTRNSTRNRCRPTSLKAFLAGLAVVVAGTSCGGPEPPDADREVPPVVMEDLPRQFRPHPRFDLTLGDLHGAIAGLASDQQSRILATPQRFLDLVAQALEEPEELLWLVDREHPLPADYIPPDLVSLTELYGDHLTLNRPDLSLRALVMPDLLAMAEAARREGVDLDLSSTYRSYRYQEWLFQYWVDEVGLERAERSSARPGTSQHQLGTAIDFGSITGPFAEHPAGRWLAAHAWRYGFSLSYPNGYEAITGYIFEPWHFRYISRPGTRLERLYFGGIQQFLLEFWEEQGALFRERYRPGGVPGASPDALPGGGDAPGSDG